MTHQDTYFTDAELNYLAQRLTGLLTEKNIPHSNPIPYEEQGEQKISVQVPPGTPKFQFTDSLLSMGEIQTDGFIDFSIHSRNARCAINNNEDDVIAFQPVQP